MIKRYKLYDWFNDYPWWVGYIGNIHSAVWFLGENPSLIQLDRQSKTLDCDINSQWNISLGDKLLRKAITEANLKTGEPFQNDGWKCYITNAIKTPEKVSARNKEKSDSNYWKKQALMWLQVLQLQVNLGQPKIIVTLGSQAEKIFKFMCDNGLEAPKHKKIHHYSYIMHRPEARTHRGPGHPDRKIEFIASIKAITKEYA